MSDQPKNEIQSGLFLVEEIDPAEVFIPEDFDQEDLMVGETVEKFVTEKIIPRKEEIEAQKKGLLKELLAEIGELGVFMADVPEEMDGLGLSKKAVMRIAEGLGLGGSFTPAAIVQAGIGGLPIIYFGTDEQRKRYLEGIMTGQKVTAYALTEPECGTDALSAKSVAKWDEKKGVYVISGTKQFITNAGFADIFIIFAKVDGEKFTCFILEKGMDGLSLGPEEVKMGLKGSSTTSVIMEEVEVPKENVLGEVGKGHKIAFNVLNIGRLKLVPAVLGGMKKALTDGARYAKEREQFGKSLSDFGLIKQKIAGAAMRIYCTESMLYRTADLIDRFIASSKASGETDSAKSTVSALQELSVECSVNKVFGSEALDWIVDEMLQVHGGYGYVHEYDIEGAYRDSRINRIWEGTNEINRMIVTGTLLKRAMDGELPLMPEIKKITDELMARRAARETPEGLLGEEKQIIDNARKISLFAAGVAAQKFLTTLQDQQEILGWIADMVIQTYAMQSVLLRTLKLEGERDAAEIEARAAAVRIAVEEGIEVVESRARFVLAAAASGEELRSMISMIRKLMRRQPSNMVDAGRKLADYVVERKEYPFS